MPVPTLFELERQAMCPHKREQIVDSKATDSDTEIFIYRCADCGNVRRDEVIGSVLRAEAENFTGRSIRIPRGL